MFSLARKIVHHKVGVIAVVAFAVVKFSGDAEEQRVQPSSPWGKSAPVQAASASSSDEDSITAKLGEVAVAAGEVVAEQLLGDKDLNPVKLGGEAVDNFNGTNDAFAKASGNN
ncbi:MAG: hypothetical protein P8J20_18405 [Novosphingobium sp.]|nr:hypothetical protein [Novosphingobium sp.]